MKEYEDRYSEEMLDRVFLFGLSGMKKHLRKTGSAVGLIAVCTFAIITALLVTSDFGSTGAGVVLSVLIGGAIGGTIACLAGSAKNREHIVKNRVGAAAKKDGRAKKEGSAA